MAHLTTFRVKLLLISSSLYMYVYCIVWSPFMPVCFLPCCGE